MANIPLSLGETFVLSKKDTITYIKSSTDSAEQNLFIRNDIQLTGSAGAGTTIFNTGYIELTNTNNNFDTFIVFKPSTTVLSNFVLGYDDSQNRFSLCTGNSLATTANRQIFHVHSGSRILHVDEGLVVTGSVSINNGTARALAVTGSAMAYYTTTTAASLTFGAAAGQIFRNENAEFAFGLHNAASFPLYIQGRYNSNVASSIAINPLGGPVVIGSTTIDTTYQLDVAGKLRVSGDLVVTGSAIANLTYATAASLTFGAAAGQIFRNESAEFAFGLHNAGSYPLYIQGRINTNSGRDIAINPLGGSVVIGSTTIDTTYKLDVAGKIRVSGDLVVTGSLDIADTVRYRGEIYSEFTFTASGNYTAGTFYNVVNSSQLVEGLYIIQGYLDTYNVGSNIYDVKFASIPFYWYVPGIGSNDISTQTLPAVIGSGHAINSVTLPTFRLLHTYSSTDGKLYLQFNPSVSWTGIDGTTGGKRFDVYLKRIG